MKRLIISLGGLCLLLPGELRASPFQLQYGGRLTNSIGRPITGPISLNVNFFHAATGGAQVASKAFANVTLSDGLFNITIDLPAAEYATIFAGAEVWLEITDVTNGKIYPRQKFGSVPYAMRVPVDGTSVSFNTSGQLQVSGLKGAALPAGDPADGQVLKWKDGTGWEWGSAGAGGAGAIDSTAIQDGAISDADVAAAAAIAGTKIAPNFGAQNITTTGTISGDGSGLTNLPAGPLGNSIESAEIADGTIVDADIAAGAAIDQSKINGLSAALSAREPAIAAGTSAQYLRGDKSWATLDTAAIPENTNLYFTEARARAAVSATAPLAYNSTTGVFSLPAATSVANGYLSSGDWLAFNNKQAAITAASTVNTGTLTSSLQIGLQLEPFGTNAGETGELRFKELAASGSNYIGFKAPSTLAGDLVYVLPPTDGSGGQFLSTDGSGNLTWGSVVGGAGGTVTSITAGTGLTGGTITGSGTINLANTAVGAGSYTRANITVDAQGRLTAAANGSALNLASEVTGTLPVASGGTGATTAGDARTALGAAASGANSDITSITGLTTALSLAQGGTGATTAPLARTALSAAASGANSDITSITGLTTALSLAQGGTGATTAPLARTALSAASSGANSDITSISGLTTALSIAQGGSGATTAPLARTALGAAASGTNSDITSITGLTTALSIAQGGTGATTAGDSRTALGLGGLATLNAVASAQITDATIVDADISGSAAIAQSKIANLTSDLSGLSSGIAGKEATITAGTTAQYWRGDKSWQTLDTSIVPENTNLYFTDARARAAVSGTAPVSYNSGTGAFSMAAATSVANGYLSSGDWLTFNSKQAAISAASTVNTGTLTTALQNGLELKPFGTNAGEAGEIRFNELVANGSEYIGFKAPNAIGTTRIWTLPAADGTNGQVLSTNGTGTLSWLSPGGGGTVTSITAGTGLSGGTITGSGTIDLANTAVTPGAYVRADITVDAQGRITAAGNGSNVDLTSDITGALQLSNGGTGATTAPLARTSLGAAASGANSDITSITGLTTALSLSQGGTGATTAALARTSLGLGGLATLNAVSTSEITNGTIADVDISASAAIVDTKLATIATAGKVSNSATTATSSNTNSAIVARDGSGNFSAGTITATLVGNASTATTAGSVSGTVAIANGGTGATTAALARTALGVAASGANSDITSLSGLTSMNSANVVIGTGDGTGTLGNGSLRGPAASGTNIAGSDILISASNGTGTGGSGDIRFQTAAAGGTGATANNLVNRMTIDNAGYVGIGTTNPVEKLHLEQGNFQIMAPDGGNAFIDFHETDFNDRFAIFTDFSGGGDSNGFHITSTGAGAAPSVSDARLTILQSGKVGIGTTVPNGILGLYQDTSSSIGRVQLKPSTTNSSTSGFELAWEGGIDFAKITAVNDADSRAYMSFQTLDGGLGERMRITHNGKVGIGTTEPTERLDLGVGNLRMKVPAGGIGYMEFAENDYSYERMGIAFDGASDGKMYITSTFTDEIPSSTNALITINALNGNMGIGTTDPDEKLTVSGNLSVSGTITGTVSGNATNVTGTVAIANGGTGATTAALARTALGLGSLATSSTVDLTSSVTGALPLANGGTGATTAALSRTALGLGGLATLSAVGASEITDLSITNTDISASAAIVDTKLATISTAGKVSNSATTATNANTASAIVARDASGNFTAGTITATLSGNASTATTAGNVTGTVAIANGGTGATTAALARTALGLGSLATSSNVDLTSSVTGALPIANGGTGATTAALARTALGLGSLATLSAVGSSDITDLSITNSDISASAAIVDTKLATISTAGKVSNAATTATSANTASAIVARDASGNFTAGQITANTGVAFSDGSSMTTASASGGVIARVERTADVSVSNNTSTCISWTVEAVDTGTFWTSGAATRLTIPTTGFYMVGGAGGWTSDNTGVREIAFRKNGAEISQNRKAASGGSASILSFMDAFTAGDYLEMCVLQTSGGALNFNYGKAFFWIMRVN